MFIAQQNYKRIDIDEYEEGDVYCPLCHNKMIVKNKGLINAHHFAHKVKPAGNFYFDMSQWHRDWQSRFPVKYREIIIEHKGIKHIVDVRVNHLLIEFQNVSIPPQLIEEKNRIYKHFGKVAWLFNVEGVNHNIERNKRFDGSYYLKWKWKRKSILYSCDRNVYTYLYLGKDDIFRIDYLTKKNGIYASKLTDEEFMDDMRKLYRGISTKRFIKFN